MKNILQCKERDIPHNIDDGIENFERESERDIEPMIEDVERNSSEEIESPCMYMYVECILLKLYIFINLIIYWICKLIMYYSFKYVQMKSMSVMRC